MEIAGRICALGFLLSSLAAAAPTFTRDVAPIFYGRCVQCHRPNDIAPMSLLDYKSARPWAKAIRESVLTRKMPPWFADPAFGHFMEDRRLSKADLNRIVAWVDAGAPAGDVKDQPPPVEWREGWNIRADEVFQVPEAYKIPAAGTLPYVYLVIPTGFVHDTWVTAAEVRPSNRSVVHHIIAVVRPPGSQWMKQAKPLVPYVPAAEDQDGEPTAGDPLSSPVDISYELLAAYSPGMQPQRFDIDRSAKLVPAGSDIVLQIHYTPNGTELTDRPEIGLHSQGVRFEPVLSMAGAPRGQFGSTHVAHSRLRRRRPHASVARRMVEWRGLPRLRQRAGLSRRQS